MRWIEDEVTLTPEAAAHILHGMRLVAQADGKLDPRELHLIDTFEAHVKRMPRGGEPPTQNQFISSFMRALILVALADGAVSDTERNVIIQLAGKHGVFPEQVAQRIVDVKGYFVDVMADVELFHAAVAQVAADAGMTDDQIATILPQPAE